MTQVPQMAPGLSEELSVLAATICDKIDRVDLKVDDALTRITALEQTRVGHSYTKSATGKEQPRGAVAPICPISGREMIPTSSASSKGRLNPEASPAAAKLLGAYRTRKQANAQITGGKHLMFVVGGFTGATLENGLKARHEKGDTFYWIVKDNLTLGMEAGMKLTTDQVDIYSTVVQLCEEIDPITNMPYMYGGMGATQRVVNFLKANV